MKKMFVLFLIIVAFLILKLSFILLPVRFVCAFMCSLLLKAFCGCAGLGLVGVFVILLEVQWKSFEGVSFMIVFFSSSLTFIYYLQTDTYI